MFCISAGTSITGYVTDVSPVKIARSGKPYFKMEIQTAQNMHDALCFSPSKRRLFNEMCVERRGCMIDNIKEGKDVVFINDYSTVVPKELVFSQNQPVEYKSIDEVITGVQLDSKVNVRGVLILDPIRTVTGPG